MVSAANAIAAATAIARRRLVNRIRGCAARFITFPSAWLPRRIADVSHCETNEPNINWSLRCDLPHRSAADATVVSCAAERSRPIEIAVAVDGDVALRAASIGTAKEVVQRCERAIGTDLKDLSTPSHPAGARGAVEVPRRGPRQAGHRPANLRINAGNRVQNVVIPAAAAWSHLEDGARRIAVVAAVAGGSVEIALRIKDHASPRLFPGAVVYVELTEKHTFIPTSARRTQLEDRPAVGGPARDGCAVEIASGVEDQVRHWLDAVDAIALKVVENIFRPRGRGGREFEDVPAAEDAIGIAPRVAGAPQLRRAVKIARLIKDHLVVWERAVVAAESIEHGFGPRTSDAAADAGRRRQLEHHSAAAELFIA